MLRRLTASAVRSRRYLSTQGARYLPAGLESLPPLSASSIEPPPPPQNWGQAYEKGFDDSKLPDAPVPLAVQAIYHAPLRIPAPYNVPVCDLQIRSYAIKNVEFFADFAMRAAYYLKIPAAGPIPLPRRTERWTVPKGVFVHKKAQQNFERVTYKRMIQLKDAHPDVVQVWLAFLRKHEYYGIGMKANVYTFEKLGAGSHFAQRLGEIKERAKAGKADHNQQLSAMKRAFNVGHTLPDGKSQKAINHAKRVKFIAKLNPLEKAAGALEAELNSIRFEVRTEFGQVLAEKRKLDNERQAQFLSKLRDLEARARAAATTLNDTRRDLKAEFGKGWRRSKRVSEVEKGREASLRRLEKATDTLGSGIPQAKRLLDSHKPSAEQELRHNRLMAFEKTLRRVRRTVRSVESGINGIYGVGWRDPKIMRSLITIERVRKVVQSVEMKMEETYGFGWRDPKHVGILVRIQRVTRGLGAVENRINEHEREMDEIFGRDWRRLSPKPVKLALPEARYPAERRYKWNAEKTSWVVQTGEQSAQTDSGVREEARQSASSNDQSVEASKEEQPNTSPTKNDEPPPPPQPTESEEVVAADEDLPTPDETEAGQDKSAKETQTEEAVKKED
ncbi:mitochondrial 37S ribosomal protein rsm10 [Orbilia brochopaga]|uniref:Small ribosomal subunit protein uS10m n=1 Tax=Orbilia brochopaga TaxID=3140254 RepID=A0AAV9UUR3_9PEZI